MTKDSLILLCLLVVVFQMLFFYRLVIRIFVFHAPPDEKCKQYNYKSNAQKHNSRFFKFFRYIWKVQGRNNANNKDKDENRQNS